MADLVDLGPAGERLVAVAANVTDDQLDDPTPCEGRTVGQLVQHLVGLTLAFRAAADKDLGPLTDTSPDAAGWPDVRPGWREALAEQVPALVTAWRDPAAWEGMTRAGGVDLPGQVGGLVALDEIVLHGWDLAVATGHPFDVRPDLLSAVHGFVESFGADPQARGGLFGPIVDVPADAPALDRVLGLAGRDPRWPRG